MMMHSSLIFTGRLLKGFLLLSLLICAFLPADASWPVYLDLNIGETRRFSIPDDVSKTKHQISVQKVEHLLEDNLWYKLPEMAGRTTIIGVRLTLLLNGQEIQLLQRPYQLPVVYQGLQLYVENTKNWAEQANFQQIKNMKKQVRLAIALQGDIWGPEELKFPIADYRWRSGAYNNTWGSVVPYNSLYYHRGEDFGVLPNRLDVKAVLNGKVIASPLPNGDGLSNAILLDHGKGFISRYAHVNTVHVNADILPGASVANGQVMAKTGNTYRKPNAQFKDPHLHVNFEYQGNAVSTFPYLVGAYFRDYPDTVLAVAGGYAHLKTGQELHVDATRSIFRQGHDIASYTWKLSDGREVNTPTASRTYEQPGLYTEELIVKTKSGAEDRDYLQVRVFGSDDNKEVAYGWAYHMPVRGLKAGQPVLIWNRLVQTRGDVMIDYGDGTPTEKIEREIRHVYQRAGLYTVTISGNGLVGGTATIKMKIVVEN